MNDKLHEERKKAHSEMDAIITADLASNAEKYRVSCLQPMLDKVDNAIRSGKYETAFGTALVTALYYPSDLRNIGYHVKESHEIKECKYAFNTMEVLLRLSFVLLSHVATDRGLDVAAIAAITAGQTPLKDAFSAAKDKNRTTRYGIVLPSGKPWTESMSGDDWEKLPQATRERLVKLEDALNSLNHSNSCTKECNDKETDSVESGKYSPYPEMIQKSVAVRYNAARIAEGKKILRRDFCAEHKQWLKEKKIYNTDDLNRCMDSAIKHKFLPPWNTRKRKTSGKS